MKKIDSYNYNKPSEKDDSNKIKQLGIWLNCQIQNYKKQIRIMKNEDIKVKFENFINSDKYKVYFLSNE